MFMMSGDETVWAGNFSVRHVCTLLHQAHAATGWDWSACMATERSQYTITGKADTRL